MNRWRVRETFGDAATFHARGAEPARSATFVAVSTRTLVLGSAQPDTDVDRRVADALAINVVRRRSGGGAVLLMPGEFIWLDLVVPAGDVLWVDDIGRSMLWVGELWQRALAAVGVTAEVSTTVADSATPSWARRICFTGVGNGEVLLAGRKLVGVSQRRTRSAARFQSLCHLRWRPEVVVALMAAPRPVAAELAPMVACVPVPAAEICAALQAQLENF
ncbi:MAG: hypothetical protein HY826_04340 [Actinobacteria bacterium]|nr:hypothetical protein [Actinomycetota bacterium]